MNPGVPDRRPHTRGGLAGELARGLRDGLAEIAVVGLVVLVAVGAGAGLGYVVGDGWGAVVGGVVALALLAAAWVVLLLAGIRVLSRRSRAGTR
jgi:hypothetical protein